jgi:hypothetical protein
MAAAAAAAAAAERPIALVADELADRVKETFAEFLSA